MPELSDAGDARVQKLIYSGRIGALYLIFIKIILLNLITLTIYQFWGKTRLRRYVWSHMELQGEHFEYTGTGLELFLGFLFVFVLFIGAYLILILGLFAFGIRSPLAIVPRVLFPLIVLYLPMVAVYAAQRYRLTRTLWRGIRGGMSGSAWTYGLRAVGYSLIAAVTLGLATPWVRMRLLEQRFNNSYFGDAKASLQARSAPIYLGFLLGFLAFAILVALLAVALWVGFDLASVLPIAFRPHSPESPADPEQAHAVLTFAGAYFIFLAGVIMISVFAFSWYAAAFFKAIAAGLRFDNLTFRSVMGGWDYFRFWIGNIIILAVTFGFGFPIIVHRTLRFFADRLEIIGEIDVERLQQNTMPKPKTGEGLLETFDPGFW
jgi:uncharacterized membrane protein YjgN (DUF898 family)